MPSKSNYICVQCEREMINAKSGVLVEEHMDYNQPYKIWCADLRRCEGCGTEIIAGFGYNPVVEHFEKEEYEKVRPGVRYHIRESQAPIIEPIEKIPKDVF